MLEKDLQKLIKDYLETKRYVVVKFSSVGIYDQKSQSYIPQSRKGISDLLACSPNGRFVAIEVKVKPNKASKEQLEFIEEVNKNHGIGLVAYDLEDVISNLLKHP